MPDDAYMSYSMRSEHALFVEKKNGFGRNKNNHQYNTSNLAIGDKLWYT
jgi:hypothetical protein